MSQAYALQKALRAKAEVAANKTELVWRIGLALD